MDLTKSIDTVSSEAAVIVPHRRRLKLGTILQHAIIIFFCLIIVLPIATTMM